MRIVIHSNEKEHINSSYNYLDCIYSILEGKGLKLKNRKLSNCLDLEWLSSITFYFKNKRKQIIKTSTIHIKSIII